MSKNIQIQWDWNGLVNDAFIPLTEDKSRVQITYGGRGSGKSQYVALRIIHRMLFDSYFKCIVVRGTYASLEKSCFENIRDLIEDLGLTHLFEFKQQPLFIKCKHNNNSLIFRGLDKPHTLKSIKDPTSFWIEEDLHALTYDTWITLTTSLRTPKADYIQEYYSINPETPEYEYTENWFYQRFFDKHQLEKSFRDVTIMDVKIGAKTERVELAYIVHHSTYKDNPHLPASYIALLEGEKDKSVHYYNTYVLGEWSNKITGNAYFSRFERGKHISDTIIYNTNKPLHVSFDWNSNPYSLCQIWQFADDGKTVQVIDEITTLAPKNNTHDLAREFAKRYKGAEANGLFIYGDASGRAADTRTEYGVNDFTIVQKELAAFNPVFRVPPKNSPIISRKRFVNEILGSKYNGINILVNHTCKHTINDLANLKEDPDGDKLKQVKKGAQIIGHFADCIEYFLTEVFRKDYDAFNAGANIFKPVWGGFVPNPKYSF